jgi:hypothetical protein
MMNPSTAATAKGLLIAEADCALAEFDELTRTRTKSGLSRLGRDRTSRVLRKFQHVGRIDHTLAKGKGVVPDFFCSWGP